MGSRRVASFAPQSLVKRVKDFRSNQRSTRAPEIALRAKALHALHRQCLVIHFGPSLQNYGVEIGEFRVLRLQTKHGHPGAERVARHKPMSVCRCPEAIRSVEGVSGGAVQWGGVERKSLRLR